MSTRLVLRLSSATSKASVPMPAPASCDLEATFDAAETLRHVTEASAGIPHNRTLVAVFIAVTRPRSAELGSTSTCLSLESVVEGTRATHPTTKPYISIPAEASAVVAAMHAAAMHDSSRPSVCRTMMWMSSDAFGSRSSRSDGRRAWCRSPERCALSVV